MKKYLLAALSLATLAVVGCATPTQDTVDLEDSEENIAETEDEITGFFGNGTTSGSSIPAGSCSSPQVVDPMWSGGAMYISIPGSCIQNGATLKMYVPFSTTQYGPYPLSINDSGTRMYTPYLGNSVMPAGSCRLVQFTNPDGKESNIVSYCR